MYEAFEALDTVVVAISQEDRSLESAARFLNGFEEATPFTIAADLERQQTAGFDRSTAYLIDRRRVVRQVFPMTITRRAAWESILAEVRALAAEPAPPAEQEPEESPEVEPVTPPERQFDFWVGRWRVTNQDGTPAGSNTIRLIHGNRVLREEWVGASGGTGSSLNAWDAARQVWHQTWMDGSGTVLLLDGGLEDGSMVMRGTQPAAGGGTARHEIRWTPMTEERVQQVWRVSTDDGANWRTLADLIYIPDRPAEEDE